MITELEKIDLNTLTNTDVKNLLNRLNDVGLPQKIINMMDNEHNHDSISIDILFSTKYIKHFLYQMKKNENKERKNEKIIKHIKK